MNWNLQKWLDNFSLTIVQRLLSGDSWAPQSLHLAYCRPPSIGYIFPACSSPPNKQGCLFYLPDEEILRYAKETILWFYLPDEEILRYAKETILWFYPPDEEILRYREEAMLWFYLPGEFFRFSQNSM